MALTGGDSSNREQLVIKRVMAIAERWTTADPLLGIVAFRAFVWFLTSWQVFPVMGALGAIIGWSCSQYRIELVQKTGAYTHVDLVLILWTVVGAVSGFLFAAVVRDLMYRYFLRKERNDERSR